MHDDGNRQVSKALSLKKLKKWTMSEIIVIFTYTKENTQFFTTFVDTF
jgi:hypothetical protein